MPEIFDTCIAFVLNEEGGYTPGLPNDPGGETNFGISKRAYPSLDIEKLTLAEATEIYRQDYWLGPGLDRLPAKVALLILDCAVNQGAGTAVKLLQHALGVEVDGELGPITAGSAWATTSGPLLREIAALRALRYAQAPNFETFADNWLRRLFRAYTAALLFGA